jgi:hypothetical protein
MKNEKTGLQQGWIFLNNDSMKGNFCFSFFGSEKLEIGGDHVHIIMGLKMKTLAVHGRQHWKIWEPHERVLTHFHPTDLKPPPGQTPDHLVLPSYGRVQIWALFPVGLIKSGQAVALLVFIDWPLFTFTFILPQPVGRAVLEGRPTLLSSFESISHSFWALDLSLSGPSG